MKKKLVIAVILALVMLVTLATPALADSARGPLDKPSMSVASGKYALRTTHDNYVVVSVTVTDIPTVSTQPWYIMLKYDGVDHVIGTAEINARGTFRFKGTTNDTFNGTVSFQVIIRYASETGSTQLWSPVEELTFK